METDNYIIHVHCTLYLDDCLRQFEVIEYSEDDIEEVLPPVGLVERAVGLHDLKHHRQSSEGGGGGRREGGRERREEKGREGGREGEMERVRDREKEGEGEREREKEGEREGEGETVEVGRDTLFFQIILRQ